jgi:hypothetical protein
MSFHTAAHPQKWSSWSSMRWCQGCRGGLTVLPDLSEKKTLYSRESGAPSSAVVYSADTTLQPWRFRLCCTAALCRAEWRSGAALIDRELVEANACLPDPLTTADPTHCGSRDTQPATIALAAAMVTCTPPYTPSSPHPHPHNPPHQQHHTHIQTSKKH